jgi:hypothetical protein
LRRGEATTSARARKRGSSAGGRFPANAQRSPRPRPGARARRLDLAGLAAHEHELRFGHAPRPRPQQVHALVRLEVAGVEDDRARVEPSAARKRATSSAAGGRRIDEGRVFDLEDGGAGRARADAFGEARAHGDHGGGVAQGVTLQRGRRPLQGAAPREAGLAQLVGDGRVDVHHQGQAEDAGQRRGQMGGLFDRVHDVEAAGQHPPRRLGHERAVETGAWPATLPGGRARRAGAGCDG